MSIRLMTLAWDLADISHTQKLVLLALCDSANDHGMCYPSVATLQKKCNLSDRGVQKCLADLQKMGVLAKKMRKGHSTVYVVSPSKESYTPERGSPPPPNHVHPTPERGSPITVIEPSIEPSINQNTDCLVISKAAELCSSWMSLGIVHCNPSHPKLLALIGEGAAQIDFDFAGMTARDLGKGFGYALGIVATRLADRKTATAKLITGHEVPHETRTRFAENYPWLSTSSAEC